MKLTIAIPTYNGEKYLKQTLTSVFRQNFPFDELLISDDCSTDQTLTVVKNYKDRRINILTSSRNLGCGLNLQKLYHYAKGDILFFICQDDLLLPNTLKKVYYYFTQKKVGAVIRPFYWFDKDPQVPVRATTPLDKTSDQIISISESDKIARTIFSSIGQLSGLAYLKKYIQLNFHPDIFTTHIYPFLSIAKKHPLVFLKDYTVAVRISSSQTRLKPSIYQKSPTLSWIIMLEKVFPGKKYQRLRHIGISQITTHFAGLIQIKNFSSLNNLFKEILILVKYHPINLVNPLFWFFASGTIIIPKKLLLFLVDNFKNYLLAKKLKFL